MGHTEPKIFKKFKFKYNKVASAMLTNHALLKEIAKERKNYLYLYWHEHL